MADVGAPVPEVYRLSMEKLPLAAGRARRFAFVGMLAGATGLIALIELALRGSALATDITLVVWALTAVTIPYAMWRGAVRVRRRWNAFELAIGNETLRCAARGSGRVVIRFDEVASASEGANGLVVRGKDPSLVIRIPRTVEGFVDVRARISRRVPLVARADALLWCGALLGTGLLAAMTALLWSRSGTLAAGVILCQASASVVAAIEVRWHQRLPRAKKVSLVLALALAAVLPVLGFVASALIG